MKYLIKSYHAHVYFDEQTKQSAISLREILKKLPSSYVYFNIKVGKIHDKPIGPHPKSMYQIYLDHSDLSCVLETLILNRGNLDVLIHPNTDNALNDHTKNAIWLGNKLLLNLDNL